MDAKIWAEAHERLWPNEFNKRNPTKITVEQLQAYLNREPGKIHGCMLKNIDEILRLAIAHLTRNEA